MTRFRPLLLAAAVALLPGSVAGQDAEAPPVARYRQSLMEGLQSHTGALRSLLGGGFDRSADVLPHAESVASLAAMLNGLFPEGTGGEGTRALPAVWENPEGFAEAMRAFQTAADALLAAARTGDAEAASAAMQDVNVGCRNCHGDFRARPGG